MIKVSDKIQCKTCGNESFNIYYHCIAGHITITTVCRECGKEDDIFYN